MRLDKQVMCGLAYSYVFSIRLYVPNTLMALSKLSVFSIGDKGDKNYICGESQRILVNAGYVDPLSPLFVNLCENT